MRSLSLLVILFALLFDMTGCSSLVTITPEGTPVPTSTQPSLATSTTSGFLFSPVCALEKQQLALKPEHQSAVLNAGVHACYDIDVSIDPDSQSYSGNLRLAFLNDTNIPIHDIDFRLYPNTRHNFAGELSIHQVTIKGKPALTRSFFSDRSGLQISLPESLSPGDAIDISMTYSGRIPESSATYGIFNYDPKLETIALADSFPILAARNPDGWMMDEIQPFGDSVTSETSLFHMTVEISAPWQIAASGIAIRDEVTNGLRISEFVSGPMRDFMLVASPNFIISETVVEGTVIRQWSLPENEEEQERALEIASGSLTMFSDLYGDYPYNELDIVTIELNNASGVEYPGLILMEKTLYPPEGRDLNRLAMVIAHEVVHQWWYGLVGNDVQKHPWQDEALATYASLIYMDSSNPGYGNGTREYFRENVSKYGNSLNNNGYQISDALSEFKNNPKAYSAIVYQKGALFFDALMAEIGADAFNASLASYFSQFQFQLADPDDLLNEFESQCNCDLTSFYQGWGMR